MLTSRPNIVFILADDMGYGDFGCFNGGGSQTPALDRLAGEGVAITQHYSASPVCAPARAALLTGRYPHRTGAIDTLEMRGLDRLALRERTIADHLRRAGYATGLIGKWHNGALDARYHPNRRGFDEFAGFSGGWSPYVDWRLDRNGSVSKSDGRYLTDVLTEEAVQFIARHEREPFLLMLTYSAPHFPFHALEDDLAPFAATGAYTAAVSHIYGMIRCLDRGVARVLAELDRRGLAENTLLIFTSDNGPQFGGAGEMCSDRFNCGFAGAKLLVYEGGIRVPAIVRWPAQPAGGRQVREMMHFTDWLPTLLSAAGMDPPRDLPLDGVDAMPLLRGEPNEMPSQRFWQWNRYTPVAECNAAMRDGDWKLVLPAIDEAMQLSRADLAMDIDSKYHPEKYSDIVRDGEPQRTIDAAPAPQLFDLRSDPQEQHDLAASQPARVMRMQGDLAAWFEDVESERRSIPA
ncbi:MAG: sulfatase-like hydrolase/transferase [Chloroflexota bacterium]|nr:sulfatase-like hydrolase/transferase [Chloroflexota bacterium]